MGCLYEMDAVHAHGCDIEVGNVTGRSVDITSERHCQTPHITRKTQKSEGAMAIRYRERQIEKDLPCSLPRFRRGMLDWETTLVPYKCIKGSPESMINRIDPPRTCIRLL